MTYRTAVLLDRDGTLVKQKHYLSDPDDVEILSGAIEGLKYMLRLGFGLVVITNQSGVGRRIFTLDQMNEVNERMYSLYARAGIFFDGLFYCPHCPEDGCECRKPKIGMAKQAAYACRFVLADAFMIGDKACDIEFGRNAGMKSILVRTGYGEEYALDGSCVEKCDFIADDLLAAAKWIATSLNSRIQA